MARECVWKVARSALLTTRRDVRPIPVGQGELPEVNQVHVTVAEAVQFGETLRRTARRRRGHSRAAIAQGEGGEIAQFNVPVVVHVAVGVAGVTEGVPVRVFLGGVDDAVAVVADIAGVVLVAVFLPRG